MIYYYENYKNYITESRTFYSLHYKEIKQILQVLKQNLNQTS